MARSGIPMPLEISFYPVFRQTPRAVYLWPPERRLSNDPQKTRPLLFSRKKVKRNGVASIIISNENRPGGRVQDLFMDNVDKNVPRLVDSHCHLEMPEFKRDLEEVIQRAIESGVDTLFTVGTEKKDWARALEIAETHPFIYAILGVHPHNAKEIDGQTYSQLRTLCRGKKVRAYGEIGLDFFRNLSPREVQIKRFREQIGLAKELQLPIVVHDRDAHQETLEILRSEKASECGGIIHCFSGDYEMAKQCLDMGFYISVPGTLTFKNAAAFHDIVQRLPLESLLVETDAPFLTPAPFRGKRNEPSYVRYTAQKLAEVKKVSLAKVGEVTTQNAFKIFRLEDGA
jgi:TatD DNase family protein